jgi:hypothetical protein
MAVTQWNTTFLAKPVQRCDEHLRSARDHREGDRRLPPGSRAERHRLADIQLNGELLHLPCLRSGYRFAADAEFGSDKLPLRTRLGIMLALAAGSWSLVLILFKLIYSALVH